MAEITLPEPQNPDIFSFGFDKNLNRLLLEIESPVIYNAFNEAVEGKQIVSASTVQGSLVGRLSGETGTKGGLNLGEIATVTILYGAVGSDGVAQTPAVGWTSARDSLGIYTITYTTQFKEPAGGAGGTRVASVVATSLSVAITFGIVTASTNAIFRIEMRDAAGALADNGFYFIVMGRR